MDKIMLPKNLTAENGAKALLGGEFKECKTVVCTECYGEDPESPNSRCDACYGSGEIEVCLDISWITIKEIYSKIVKHFGEEVL